MFLCDVFRSITAMQDGSVFSPEQLSIIEGHLREAVKLASHSANDVRTAVTCLSVTVVEGIGIKVLKSSNKNLDMHHIISM